MNVTCLSVDHDLNCNDLDPGLVSDYGTQVGQTRINVIYLVVGLGAILLTS